MTDPNQPTDDRNIDYGFDRRLLQTLGRNSRDEVGPVNRTALTYTRAGDHSRCSRPAGRKYGRERGLWGRQAGSEQQPIDRTDDQHGTEAIGKTGPFRVACMRRNRAISRTTASSSKVESSDQPSDTHSEKP
jgi:hypothetical protein